MKLNTAYIATVTIDYCWLSFVFWSWYKVGAGADIKSVEGVLASGICVWTPMVVGICREYLYNFLFNNAKTFSPYKMEWSLSDNPSYYLDILQTFFLSTLIATIPAQIG